MTSWLSAVERTVTGLGYDLVDAERSAGGLLRVFIDRPFVEPGSEPAVGVEPAAEATPAEQFVNVDDCERVIRQLQHVLEVEGCAYERLEVSSPGLDRPLKKPIDYRRFVGEPVEITLKEPFQGRKKWQGELQANGGDWRLLLADDSGPKPKKGAPVRKAPPADASRRALDFSLDEVRDARLVPVLDFKGRRFAAPEVDETGAAVLPDDKMDGGRTL